MAVENKAPTLRPRFQYLKPCLLAIRSSGLGRQRNGLLTSTRWRRGYRSITRDFMLWWGGMQCIVLVWRRATTSMTTTKRSTMAMAMAMGRWSIDPNVNSKFETITDQMRIGRRVVSGRSRGRRRRRKQCGWQVEMGSSKFCFALCRRRRVCV